jgi:inner membrane transporter RhtA
MPVAAIVSVQLGTALVPPLFDSVGVGGAGVLRFGFSAALLLAIARPTLRGRSGADLLAVLMFGVVMAAQNEFLYAAIDRIPLAVAVTISFLGPLGVAVAGSRLAIDFLWPVLAGAGVLLVARVGGSAAPLQLTGLLLAGGAAAGWASYILLAARVGARWDGLEGLALAAVVTTVLLLPVGVAQGGGRLLEPGVLGLGVVVALLTTAITFSLEVHALRWLAPRVMGIFACLEPGVAALAGLVVLGQALSLTQWAGIVLAASACAGASVRVG